MERYSEEAFRNACLVQREADALAGVQWYQRGKTGPLATLPQWTAWLLMEKAGVPLDLIASIAYVEPRFVRRRVQVAKTLMLWPPYAARVEAMTKTMPRFGAAYVPTLKPAKGDRCAARVG